MNHENELNEIWDHIEIKHQVHRVKDMSREELTKILIRQIEMKDNEHDNAPDPFENADLLDHIMYTVCVASYQRVKERLKKMGYTMWYTHDGKVPFIYDQIIEFSLKNSEYAKDDSDLQKALSLCVPTRIRAKALAMSIEISKNLTSIIYR